MVPDNYSITDEGYIIVDGTVFEDIDAYLDYIN